MQIHPNSTWEKDGECNIGKHRKTCSSMLFWWQQRFNSCTAHNIFAPSIRQQLTQTAPWASCPRRLRPLIQRSGDPLGTHWGPIGDPLGTPVAGGRSRPMMSASHLLFHDSKGHQRFWIRLPTHLLFSTLRLRPENCCLERSPSPCPPWLSRREGSNYLRQCVTRRSGPPVQNLWQCPVGQLGCKMQWDEKNTFVGRDLKV